LNIDLNSLFVNKIKISTQIMKLFWTSKTSLL